MPCHAMDYYRLLIFTLLYSFDVLQIPVQGVARFVAFSKEPFSIGPCLRDPFQPFSLSFYLLLHNQPRSSLDGQPLPRLPLITRFITSLINISKIEKNGEWLEWISRTGTYGVSSFENATNI